MNREEYLVKMQEYREQLQWACKNNRVLLDNLAQEHKQKVRIEQDDYDRKVKEVRDAHTENQHRIEKKMHELKVQWAKEHPAEEVKVVE